MLFVLPLLVSVLFGSAQTTVARWNFNNGTLSPSVGAGTLSLTGSAISSYATGAEGFAGDSGLQTTNYPAQGLNPKTAGINITFNSVGYNTIRLKFQTRHSDAAAEKVVVQYFDGLMWVDAVSYTIAQGTTWYTQDFSLSAYTALNNNPNAQLRLVTDFSNGSNYQGTESGYTSGPNGGTIRFDLITITGNTLSCVGPATQQAAGLRLLKTDATSAQLTLNRGDGGGCLVICSNSGIPSPPVNNTVYTANASFMSGSAIGNGYAVYNTQIGNPAIQYFNITGLVAGTKYYVAAYEYSAGGTCYLTPGLVDSFYCNSTVLYPGDVQFVGYDNNDSTGGRDFFVLTNLATLKKGTTFQIVNSRFEAGAAANERTNRWYAGDNNIHQNLQRITVTYKGDSIAAGSIISFNHKKDSAVNIKINGSFSTELAIHDNLTLSNLLSGSGAEQIFVTQGKFTSYGSSTANNQYSFLNGHVLHGFSYDSAWVEFDKPCDSGAVRHSRIPPDISGLKLFFNTGGFAYYNTTSPHVDSLNVLLTGINYNLTNWTVGSSASGNQVTPAVLNTTFSPNRVTAAGTWTGAANDNNWFNALNWEGLFVPDSSKDVVIPTGKISLINANAPLAELYNRVAVTRALTIAGGTPFGGTLAIDGPGSDKLVVHDSLLVDSTGRFSALRNIDTIVLHGNLQRRDGAQVQAFDSSFLFLEENRMLKPIDILLITGTIYSVRKLAVNNLPGVRLLNGGIETVEELRLTIGVLSVIEGPATYNLSRGCNIVSPITNKFNENKGWEKSFIDGRVNINTNAAIPYTAPVGSAAKNIFAPLTFEPDNTNNRVYSVKYIPAINSAAPPTNIATPPLDHVSELEHWNIDNFFSPNSPAKITLYYTPYSRVGGSGNPTQALSDLRIAQFWDSLAPGGEKWRLYSSGGNYNVSGDSNYGKISYDQYATDFRIGSRNFTIGTISKLNTLPVQLLTWKATLQTKRVQLNWQVADESDVSYYTIEKSTDGLHYTPLQKISKSITSNLYTIYDDKPADGWNYYRLKATGTDGKIFYSDIQRVWSASPAQWVVYPNPATDVVWLQLPATGTVSLYTVDGKMVLQRKLPASLNKLNIKSFAKGLYVLEYFDGRKRLTQKINLQ